MRFAATAPPPDRARGRLPPPKKSDYILPKPTAQDRHRAHSGAECPSLSLTYQEVGALADREPGQVGWWCAETTKGTRIGKSRTSPRGFVFSGFGLGGFGVGLRPRDATQFPLESGFVFVAAEFAGSSLKTVQLAISAVRVPVKHSPPSPVTAGLGRPWTACRSSASLRPA